MGYERSQFGFGRYWNPTVTARVEDGDCGLGLAEQWSNAGSLGIAVHSRHLRKSICGLEPLTVNRLVLTTYRIGILPGRKA